LAAKILGAFKQQMSALTLIPSDGGRFELVVNGETIYSKLQSGTFPDEGVILEKLRQRNATGTEQAPGC
jgi:selenoprotein W-related protein